MDQAAHNTIMASFAQHERQVSDLEDSWKQQAKCRGMDPSIFFDFATQDEAKAVCAKCPVSEECLEFAMKSHPFSKEINGIWGGYTGDEIRTIRRRKRRLELKEQYQ